MLKARQEIDRVLSELGALVGAPLQLDADGLIVMEFADDITCTIEVPEEAGHVLVELTVGRLPREGREAVLAAALRRNLFGFEVAGTWFALDSEGEQLLLCHSLPAVPAELDSFPDILAALIAEAAASRSLLTEGMRPAGESDAAAPALDFDAPTLLFRG